MMWAEVKIWLAVGGFAVESGDEFVIVVKRDGEIKVIDSGGGVIQCKLDGGMERIEKASSLGDWWWGANENEKEVFDEYFR